MNLFGGAAKFVDFENSKGEPFVTNNNCTTDWLSSVAATGTFTQAPGVDWSGKTGVDGIPSRWT